MKIGIVGGNGRYGTWFQRFFHRTWLQRLFGKRHHNYQVIISDLDTEMKNPTLATQADVIIVSVPVSETVKVIREISSLIAGKLVIEIASTGKEEIREALLNTEAEFLQIHPMCKPPEKRNDLKGFGIVVAEEHRLDKWGDFADSFLTKTHADIIELPLDLMEFYTAWAQAGIHGPTLAGLFARMEAEVDPKKLFAIASGFYKIVACLAPRMLEEKKGENKAKLYWGVLRGNPYTPDVLRRTIKWMTWLLQVIETNDEESFLRQWNAGKAYLGEEALHEGSDLFEVLVETTAAHRTKRNRKE